MMWDNIWRIGKRDLMYLIERCFKNGNEISKREIIF